MLNFTLFYYNSKNWELVLGLGTSMILLRVDSSIGFLPEKGSSVRSTYDLLKKSKVVLCKKYVWFNEELESGPL